MQFLFLKKKVDPCKRMRREMKCLLLWFAVWGVCLSAKASGSLMFSTYTVEDGLSHNTLLCALQDSYGFIWLGTSNGLNCFDGRKNIIYRSSSQDENRSLGNNFVRSLYEDSQKRIWVGTDCGIYIYERNRDAFVLFDVTTEFGVFISSEVSRIVQLADGMIGIATLGQGLFFYDPQKNVLTQNNMYSSFVWDICVGQKGEIYCSSLQDDILCFDRHGAYQRTYHLSSSDVDWNKSNHKANCIQLVDSTLWIGTNSKYLFSINVGTGETNHYEIGADQFRIIQCLKPWRQKKLLVGTDNGLYSFDRMTKTLVPIDNSVGDSSGNDRSINALMEDAENGIWVLTNMQGVSYLSARAKPFRRFVLPESGVVNTFCEDAANGNIWIGTRNGLYRYDKTTQSVDKYPLEEDGKSPYDIRALFLDKGKLWIGTFANGLKVLDLSTRRVKSYNHSYTTPNTICSDDVQTIYGCRNGRIYVGTSWGLCYYNPEEDNFHTETTIGVMISITDILEDGHNNIWISTANSGVFLCNQTDNYWRHYEHKRNDKKSISHNSVITLFEDSNGVMWFGTNGNGLCYFDERQRCFVNLSENNSWVSSQVIYSIEQDQSGAFWLSTNVGIVKLNPMSSEKYQRFTESDGLLSNPFRERASFKAEDGTIYLGGMNGFNAFRPSFFPSNAYVPPVYITDITLMRVDKREDVRKLLHLDKPFYQAKEVKIPYTYNSFTVYFAALSYQDPRKNHYSYKLEGVDKEWFNDLENNYVSYNNLAPGKYHLLVRGSNNDLKWNNDVADLWIIVTPPWWLSGWAYLVYCLLAVCFLAYALWRRDRHLKNKYRKRMENYQIEKEKELYKSKINFFINLVHEIRTPLSLIKLPLESLLVTDRSKEDSKYLSVIDKNVNYLLGVTNELLDFQKMEAGVVRLHLKNCDIVELLQDIYNQFIGSAELKNLVLTLDVPETSRIEAVIDADKVSKIVVNLVSNAMKYAHTRIDIRLKQLNEQFDIRVEDDGDGIPFDEKEKVFQAFYQVDNPKAMLGTGIGLAYSRSLAENCGGSLRAEDNSYGGASFILTLPLHARESDIEEQIIVSDMDEKVESPVKTEEDDPLLQQKYTVLLVEDNVELLDMEYTRLAKWFKVVKATNGLQALKVLETTAVDVVVSDVMMPKMNGLELCNKIKSDIDYSHIPVILLTAKTLPESKAEGFRYGADAYVEKPFTIVQLKMQIRNILKLRMVFHQRMQELNSHNLPEGQEEISITPRDREFLTKMQQAIEAQLADENFSIDILAADMNMSRSNFYRKLKALTGMSPNDYLKLCRLNRAAVLLKEGCRITEVCEQTGFSSSSYFAKCFRAQFGVLPKDYVTHLSQEK